LIRGEQPIVVTKGVETIDSCLATYDPFISQGEVWSGDSDPKPITILRDTGALQTLILEGVIPLSEKTYTGTSILMKGIECRVVNVPLHKVEMRSKFVSGTVIVGVRKELPVTGVEILLGNDLAGADVQARIPVEDINPIVCEKPITFVELENGDSSVEPEVVDNVVLYPSCAVTRAMEKNESLSEKLETSTVDQGTAFQYDLADTFIGTIDSGQNKNNKDESQNSGEFDGVWSCDKLIKNQKEDAEINKLREKVLSDTEIENVAIGYYLDKDILMRKWRPPDSRVEDFWRIQHQIVVPKCYRQGILSLAHDSLLAGHLGVTKTYQKILNHFYWPGLQNEVRKFCRTCHTCQMVGKPNRTIHKYPPFNKILIDCVGPEPKSKTGQKHLLAMKCTSIRFMLLLLQLIIVLTNFVKTTITYLSHVVKKCDAYIDDVIIATMTWSENEANRHFFEKLTEANYAQIAKQLTSLLKKSVKYIWTSAQEQSFNQIKTVLTNSPVLRAPNFEKQFVLYIDACDIGIGAVLQQEDDSKVEHPVCYFSRKLNKHQQNYSTIEKETLALILTLQQFEVYLCTTLHPVLVYTDHNPLVFISRMKNKNQRLMRWSIALEEYNLEIHHIKGTLNVIADALSRGFET
jgi:hypothetical protein